MNKFEENILNRTKEKIALNKFQNEFIENNTPTKRRESILKKRIIAITCASFIFASGIAIATNMVKIKKQDRGLGEGVKNAIENGYIAEPQIEFTNIDNVNAKVKLEDFFMDDVNLSTGIVFEFSDLDEKIDLNSAYEVELKDLIIKDEENRILYGGNDEEKFEKYCSENNLEYVFGNFNENYISSGVSCYINFKDDNTLKILYNMNSEQYPKSKKLDFSINEISIRTKNDNFIINGNWQTTVDVPEKMYNRSEEHYRVVNCDNNDFDVYTAKVTETGFEIGIIISNIEKPTEDTEKENRYKTVNEDLENGKITKEEANILIDWHLNQMYLNYPINISEYNIKREQMNPSYIENEKLEKFKCSGAPGRSTKNHFMDGNKFDFYETFSMTKYNATDKVTAVLYYYGTPVTIELEKIK